jgi:UDP-sulfoquinovose synthase
VWGLRATDLNQGVVYGQQTDQTARDERLATRFDYDAVFGTVLNRFVILAALGQPLTVYGDGGQTRGIIDIRDTAECVRLAAENPPPAGEFRVFNQLTESMSVLEIAKLVADLHPDAVAVEHLDNPRVEAEAHYYKVTHTGLVELGLRPHLLSDTLLTSLYAIADRYKHRIEPAALRPAVRWRQPTGAAVGGASVTAR